MCKFREKYEVICSIHTYVYTKKFCSVRVHYLSKGINYKVKLRNRKLLFWGKNRGAFLGKNRELLEYNCSTNIS